MISENEDNEDKEEMHKGLVENNAPPPGLGIVSYETDKEDGEIDEDADDVGAPPGLVAVEKVEEKKMIVIVV